MLTEAGLFASRRVCNYFAQAWHFPTGVPIDAGAGRKRGAPYNAGIATGMD